MATAPRSLHNYRREARDVDVGQNPSVPYVSVKPTLNRSELKREKRRRCRVKAVKWVPCTLLSFFKKGDGEIAMREEVNLAVDLEYLQILCLRTISCIAITLITFALLSHKFLCTRRSDPRQLFLGHNNGTRFKGEKRADTI